MLRLPVELRADLPNTRVTRVRDYSKQTAAEVAAWLIELRVVEDVEEFPVDLNGLGLGNRDSLRHAEIGVDDSGSVEKPSVGVAEIPEGVGCEGSRQKVGVCTVRSGLARILNAHGSHAIRLVS